MLKQTRLVSIAIALLFSSSSFAHPDGDDEQQAENQEREFRRHHQQAERSLGGMRMNFSQLNLNEQQQASLKTIKENNKESMKANFEAIHNLKEQVKPLLDAETIDENAVKSLSAQIADLKAEQMIKMAMLKKQLFAILTEEQKARFEELQEKRQNHRKEFRTKS